MTDDNGAEAGMTDIEPGVDELTGELSDEALDRLEGPALGLCGRLLSGSFSIEPKK